VHTRRREKDLTEGTEQGNDNAETLRAQRLAEEPREAEILWLLRRKMAAAGFLFILGPLAGVADLSCWSARTEAPILSSVIFGAVREDLRDGAELPEPRLAARKLAARRTELRGETYVNWYLRHQG
jgi:hypothetical protein